MAGNSKRTLQPASTSSRRSKANLASNLARRNTVNLCVSPLRLAQRNASCDGWVCIHRKDLDSSLIHNKEGAPGRYGLRASFVSLRAGRRSWSIRPRHHIRVAAVLALQRLSSTKHTLERHRPAPVCVPPEEFVAADKPSLQQKTLVVSARAPKP